MKITSNTKAWDKLKKHLLDSNKVHAKIGWFPEQVYGADNDNLQMAQVASWNEHGHPNGGIFAGTYTPPRPFMRVWLPEELKENKVQAAIKQAGQAAFRQTSVAGALNTSGPTFVNALQDAMRKLNHPANSEATIAMKGFDDPLRDSGQLIASATFKVARDKRGV